MVDKTTTCMLILLIDTKTEYIFHIMHRITGAGTMAHMFFCAFLFAIFL
nr:MAG TPA: hypothetical protein [Caudoviricetes sp.]